MFLPSKSLSQSWIRNNTSISTSNIVVFALSTNVFYTIWIAHCKNTTTLSATSTKNLLSINS